MHCQFCNQIIVQSQNESKSSFIKRKFCSQSCSATLSNKNRIRKKKIFYCLVCKEKCKSYRKFCSIKCRKLEYSKTHTILNNATRKKHNVKNVITFRQRKKIQAIDYKGGTCIKCGYNKCVRALSFHHLDPLKKDFNISRMSHKWETVKKELDKCILLCLNCHAEEHHNQYFKN